MTKKTTKTAAPLLAGMKRRYATRYYHNRTDDPLAVASQGAATSEKGAIRAAVVRIFLGQHGKCVVVDRVTGQSLYTLQRGARGLETKYAEGVAFKEWKEGAA